MSSRFTTESIAVWRRDGAVLLPAFFSAAEINPVADDFELLFSHFRPPCELAPLQDEIGPALSPADHTARISKQAEFNTALPFHCSPALNLIGLHPALIDFAKAALEVSDVRMYQCLAWPKFTGHTDFDQPFHMDYHNHTLTVVGDRAPERTVNFSIYASEVTDSHGAIRYVPRPEGDLICGALRPNEPVRFQQIALREIERSGAGPMGSVFAYSTDVYHRATNLTAPAGHRYTLFVTYKAAQNDAFYGNPWPGFFDLRTREARDGNRKNPAEYIFEHCTPEQLTCLYVPPPGHCFWTKLTLARAQRRWPTWNLEPWRQSAHAHADQ